MKNILKKRTEKTAQDNLTMWLETQAGERDIAHTEPCSVCGVVFMSWGNNARPINDGRCCDDCNNLVIARRIQQARNA